MSASATRVSRPGWPSWCADGPGCGEPGRAGGSGERPSVQELQGEPVSRVAGRAARENASASAGPRVPRRMSRGSSRGVAAAPPAGFTNELSEERKKRYGKDGRTCVSVLGR